MTGRLNRAEVVATGGTEPRSLADLAEKVLGVNANTGKNLIINGDFSVWQRGTVQTSSGYGTDDRWLNGSSGSAKAHTREPFTLGQTDVSGNPKYYSRTIVNSVAGASNFVVKEHRIESVTNFAGKEVTLSFWAKADAAKDIASEFIQTFGTGGSPSVSIDRLSVTTYSLTTSWQKFTATVTLPSISGKTLGGGGDSTRIVFWLDAGSDFDARTNSLGQQSGTFDIANVQLEFGDTATEFEYVHPADQEARCKRYFERLGGVAAVTTLGAGYADTTTRFDANLRYVQKRTVPTVSVSSSTGLSVLKAGSSVNSTATTAFNVTPNSTLLSLTTSGLTTGDAGCISTASISDYIDIDAEL